MTGVSALLLKISATCIILGYSKRSRGYRVYNTETQIVEESISVRFDDKLDSQKSKHNEFFTSMEVELTCNEDNSSEALNRDTPSTSVRVTASNPTPSVDQLQKRPSRRNNFRKEGRSNQNKIYFQKF